MHLHFLNLYSQYNKTKIRIHNQVKVAEKVQSESRLRECETAEYTSRHGNQYNVYGF